MQDEGVEMDVDDGNDDEMESGDGLRNDNNYNNKNRYNKMESRYRDENEIGF